MTSPPATTIDLLASAVALHRAGRTAEAATLYRRLLATIPSEANALHLLGLLEGHRNPSLGEALMRRSLMIAPLAGCYYNLANLLKGQGDSDGAITCIERGLAVLPDDTLIRETYCALTQDRAIVALGEGDNATVMVWWERCRRAVMDAREVTRAIYASYERLARIALVAGFPMEAAAVIAARHRFDFPNLGTSDIDVFPVTLHGFAEWCAAAGLACELWTPPAERPEPGLFDDYPDYLHRWVGALPDLAGQPVGVAPDADIEVVQGFFVKDNYESYVLAGRQAVLFETKTLVVSSAVVPIVAVTPKADAAVFRIPRPRYTTLEVEEPGIVLPSTPNYWHFLVEVLPMLMVRRQVPALADLPVYLFDLRGYHYEMLELAGVPRDRVIDLKTRLPDGAGGHVHYRFRHAALPSQVPYPAAYRWLRDTLLPQVRPGSADRYPKRIFLSRRGAYPKHRIANDAAIGDRLAARGFEVVQPERLSVLETVEMMAAAEVVVAPIGAGTANHVFLPPNATWIHLNNPDFFHPESEWNPQMGTQVTFIGHFRHLTGHFTGDPAGYPERLIDRLEIPVEIDLDTLDRLVGEALERL